MHLLTFIVPTDLPPPMKSVYRFSFFSKNSSVLAHELLFAESRIPPLLPFAETYLTLLIPFC